MASVNRNKARGTAWETRVVKFLQANGFPYAERRALSGALDKGDINVPGVVWECKNAKSIDLAGWVDEMVKEKDNAGVDIGVVVFPRRNHATERAYAVLELRDFVALIR